MKETDFKVGDYITILGKPKSWSSGCVDRDPMRC